MTNKGIREIPLFDPIFPKMDCPLFGVTTVYKYYFTQINTDKLKMQAIDAIAVYIFAYFSSSVTGMRLT